MEELIFDDGYTSSNVNFKKIKYIEKNGCWECTSHTDGRRYALIARNSKRIYMHRYIYELMNGEIPEGMVVMHKCDNVICINPGHLKLGTSKDNSMDMSKKGRSTKGKKLSKETSEKISNAGKKFNTEQLMGIKQMLLNGDKVKDIAEKYNCHYATISNIKNNRSTYNKDIGSMADWLKERKSI